jgi:hypothetical protein
MTRQAHTLLLFLLPFALLACAETATTPASSGSSDASADAEPSGTGSGSPDASTASVDAGGDARKAHACTTDKPPSAPASCVVEGDYDVVSRAVCPMDCELPEPIPTTPHVLRVTLTGDEVKFRNVDPDMPHLVTCVLDGCTCTSKSGRTFIFTPTGYHYIGKSSVGSNAGSCSFEEYERGILR